jgi:hypothetical protein
MTFRRIIFAMLLAGVATLVHATPASTAGEAYGSLSGDWTWHAQGLLRDAAMRSPKWRSQREAVERHIENFGYLLQNAALAVRAGDHAVAAMNMQYAIKTLELGISRGFYRRIDVEPLKLIIIRHMSENGRHDTGTGLLEGR